MHWEITSMLMLMPTINTLTLYEFPTSVKVFWSLNSLVTSLFFDKLHAPSGTLASPSSLTLADNLNDVTTAQPPFLPQLQRLELSAYDEGENWVNTLIEAVMSRAPPADNSPAAFEDENAVEDENAAEDENATEDKSTRIRSLTSLELHIVTTRRTIGRSAIPKLEKLNTVEGLRFDLEISSAPEV